MARERVFPSPRAEERARRSAELRRKESRPVFVDDSGRRRRVARFAGATCGVLALLYLLVVAGTFAGVPGSRQLEAPGLAQLVQPAGQQADVGEDPVEQPEPAAIADPASGDVGAGVDGSTTTAPPVTEAGQSPGEPTVPTTTTPTTTTSRGRGTPNSTVPDKGGPPTSRPGQQ